MPAGKKKAPPIKFRRGHACRRFVVALSAPVHTSAGPMVMGMVMGAGGGEPNPLLETYRSGCGLSIAAGRLPAHIGRSKRLQRGRRRRRRSRVSARSAAQDRTRSSRLHRLRAVLRVRSSLVQNRVPALMVGPPIQSRLYPWGPLTVAAVLVCVTAFQLWFPVPWVPVIGLLLSAAVIVAIVHRGAAVSKHRYGASRKSTRRSSRSRACTRPPSRRSPWPSRPRTRPRTRICATCSTWPAHWRGR